MSEYGVTKEGFVRKRYDVIYEEIQDDIKDATGIDIGINPKSYINVLVASFADKLTALWELAEGTYYSHYPSSAEGINLDYACQFGGVTRAEGTPSRYYILCTGDDGTTLPQGTRIASTTSPAVYFTIGADYKIERAAFNKATLRLMTVARDVVYTVYLEDTAYSYEYTGEETGDDMAIAILNGLKDAIDAAGIAFDVSVDEENQWLIIEAQSIYSNASLNMNENLTSEKISSVIIFESEEFGEFKLVENSITQIVTAVTGFDSCTNVGVPVYGSERETDEELRGSYLAKESYRSSTMLSSITSAILQNVDGVLAAIAFENDGDDYDEYGRPPHSIEVIVDGGDDAEIAQQILNYKAAGISTFGDVSVEIPTEYNSTITIRFNRPESVYVWLSVELVANPDEAMPENYEELVKTALMDYLDGIGMGENVIIQKAITNINSSVTGVAYITIKAYSTTDSAYTPSEDEYTETYVTIGARQKACFDEERITVTREIGG